MTIATLLDRTAKRLDSRINRYVETVDAVSDAQLWEILEAHGLLLALDAGELRCVVTGVALTRDNVGGILITSDGPRLVADTYAALSGGKATPPGTGRELAKAAR